MNARSDPEVSVVIPCLNEEANAEAIAEAAIGEIEAICDSLEIIFIDNGSSDRTVEIIKSMCARDPRIKLIVNNRNYGQMRSPTHAIYQARGRAVIGLCADFQDPPSLLPRFIERWRAGAKIVLGVRQEETDSPASVKLARFFGYRMLNRLGDYPVIVGATGFGLYDRAVVDALAQWREPEPFFRGMLVESGFSLETIPYARPPRAGGRTKNNFFTSADFALSALAGSSKSLLRIPLYLGPLLGLGGGLMALWALAALVFGGSATGPALAAMMLVGFAGVFFFLGLIGDQVRVIGERTRNVPLVIEKERINF